MTEFGGFLLNSPLVPQGREQYLVMWVRRFFVNTPSCLNRSVENIYSNESKKWVVLKRSGFNPYAYRKLFNLFDLVPLMNHEPLQCTEVDYSKDC